VKLKMPEPKSWEEVKLRVDRFKRIMRRKRRKEKWRRLFSFIGTSSRSKAVVVNVDPLARLMDEKLDAFLKGELSTTGELLRRWQRNRFGLYSPRQYDSKERS